MSFDPNLKQFEIPIFSSLSVPLAKKNCFKFQVMTESVVRAEIDFLWLYIFSRVQPSLKKTKLTNQRRIKRQHILIFSTFSKSYSIFYMIRKFKWMQMYLKDSAEVRTLPITETGCESTRLINCEQTCETNKMINLNHGLGFFLEDIIVFSNFFYKDNPTLLMFMKKIYS